MAYYFVSPDVEFFLYFFADFPAPYITHVDVVDAGLVALDSDLLGGSSAAIKSARFMSNKIARVDEDAFR